MIQPKAVPPFADDSVFTTGVEAGISTRLTPTDALLRQGFVANTRLPSRIANYTLGQICDHLDGIVDSPALNWSETGSTALDSGHGFQNSTTIPSGAIYARPILTAAGSASGDKFPWLFAWDDLNGHLWRSRDGKRWIRSPGDPTNPVTDIFGRQGQLVALNPGGSIFVSTDAGATWSGANALPSANNWHRVAYEPHAGFGVVAGEDKIAVTDASWATYTTPSLGAWVAGPVRPVRRIITGRPGSNAIGAMILAWDSIPFFDYLYSLDGVTWSIGTVPSSGLTSGLVAACWSESHLAWFAVTGDGVIFQSTSLAVAWTRIHDLGITNSNTCYDIAAFGRNLVILGDRIAPTTSFSSVGNMVVTSDPANGQGWVLNPDAGTYANVGTGTTASNPAHTRLTHFDGRLVASRVRTTGTTVFEIETAMSGRAAFSDWIL